MISPLKMTRNVNDFWVPPSPCQHDVGKRFCPETTCGNSFLNHTSIIDDPPLRSSVVSLLVYDQENARNI